MKKNIFLFGAIIAFLLPLFPFINSFASGIALILGIVLASFNIIECPGNTSKIRKISLNTAVVLFGFSLNIKQVIAVGSAGFIQTAVSLAIIIPIGFFLVRIFKLDKKTGSLITFGTAICGGSAIAATVPLLDADNKEIGISTGVVFLLNTIALFLFTLFSHALPLDAQQFGTWSALSIHDTSSVVGAAASHSNEALQIATILKLTRTLWIIPIVLILAFINKEKKKINFPYFIIFFILASIFASVISLPILYKYLGVLGKLLLSLALYLVGTGLKPKAIKQAGLKSILMGVCLWMISIITGYCITIFL